MALVAGRFGVTAAAAAALESSSAALGQQTVVAAPAELVRIGISARRSSSSCSIVRECFVAPVVVRPTRCRAVVTNYLEEESEVLDIDTEKKEEEKAKEEVNPLTPSAFEVRI